MLTGYVNSTGKDAAKTALSPSSNSFICKASLMNGRETSSDELPP